MKQKSPKRAFSFTFSGAKYSLLAYTTLGLESAEDNFRTHNLTITGNGKYIWYQFKEIKNQLHFALNSCKLKSLKRLFFLILNIEQL